MGQKHQRRPADIGFKRWIGLEHVTRGKPQHNAYIERCKRPALHQWLGQYIFETIENAQDHATLCLRTYNNELNNIATGYITPGIKLKTAD